MRGRVWPVIESAISGQRVVPVVLSVEECKVSPVSQQSNCDNNQDPVTTQPQSTQPTLHVRGRQEQHGHTPDQLKSDGETEQSKLGFCK